MRKFPLKQALTSGATALGSVSASSNAIFLEPIG